VEREKLLVEIIKIKLLFFSAIVGGSFGYLLKSDNYFINSILLVVLLIGVVGVVKALYDLGEIYKKLKENDERSI